jgi:NitT/TauT family transport system substrate-binding protein
MIADESTVAFWPWLKAKYGYSDAQIRKYTFNLAPFLVDPKAIQEGYLTSEPYTIEKEGGFKPQVFLLADNGYPGYANMVLVPQKWIDGNPKAVQAFVNATIAGWQAYVFGNPVPANTLIKYDNPEMTDGLIAQAIQKMRGYNLVQGGGKTLGRMSDARWKNFFDTMSSEGLYPKTLDYRKAYDLRFVKH